MAIQVREQLHDLKLQAEKWSAEEVLGWAFKSYPGKIGIASGFGVEGMVLIDIASRITKNLHVFTLDTEFLFPKPTPSSTGSSNAMGSRSSAFIQS